MNTIKVTNKSLIETLTFKTEDVKKSLSTKIILQH